MGTEYPLYKDDSFGELTIDEMSNRLTLNFIGDDEYIHPSNDMPPEEMAKIFLKGLTVCSYWMDIAKLRNMIRDHIQYEIY